MSRAGARPRHAHRRTSRYVLQCDIGGACGESLDGDRLRWTFSEFERRHVMPAHDTTFDAVMAAGGSIPFKLVDTWTGRSFTDDELRRKRGGDHAHLNN